MKRSHKPIVVKAQLAPTSAINVTPLVDVVLVLLIIFMVLTPLLEKSLDVRVPSSQTVQTNELPKEQLVVNVNAAGVLAAACKGVKLDAARRDLQMPALNRQAQESAHAFLQRVARIDAQQCPQCTMGRLCCVQRVVAPRWLPAPGGEAEHNRGPP